MVDHYSDIDFDLENTPLEIKSDSAVGSEDQIYVAFQTAQDGIAGGINIILASPPQYNLEYCSERGVNGVVVWPWAQNRKIKSSSIAAALLIPHTC